MEGDNQVVCLDIDSGRVLYRGPGFVGALYSNGRYLGIVRDGHQILIDLDHQQPVSGLTKANVWLCAMSPEGDRLIDYDGKVWQTSPVRMIDDGHRDHDGIGDCIFVCGGKKIAWVEPNASGSTIKLRSVVRGAWPVNSELLIPEYAGPIGTVDRQGNLVHFDGSRKVPEQRWWRQLLDRLGIMQAEPGLLDYHQWLLLDARTGAIVHTSRDYLRAVSADGRYAITGDDEHPEVRIYELPLRRSLLFIAVAGGAWTALVFTVRRWWRRRVSGGGEETDKRHVQAQAVT
jgi:hypothetical protein